jgi:asparagine synthase (glutamine-hydrolysing)
MCGIFGFIGKQKVNLKDCTDVISYRGPDSDGFYGLNLETLGTFTGNEAQDFAKSDVSKILFGFRRLSILDLSDNANQPMSTLDDDYTIIFNGEIYNFIEIRNKLIAYGIEFSTTSDTEVLIKSYIYWGVKCVDYFNGMWAFAIIDKRKKIVFCSRDRFGVKPFYYSFENNQIVFGSEIKQIHKFGIKKELNSNLVKDFLELGIINNSEETLFIGINQLLPGHNILINFEKEILSVHIDKYYQLIVKPEFHSISYEHAKDKFIELFNDSLKYRFRSDVPIGSCLSGGLDSSSIVCLSSNNFDTKFKTFSAIFENDSDFDESFFIKKAIEKYSNIEPYFTTVTPDEIIPIIDKIIFHQDEPFSTFSLVSQWNVMKLAQKNGVKVLLDGQGGDELMAGYRKYYAYFLKDLLKRGHFYKFMREFVILLNSKSFKFFSKEGFSRYLFSRNLSGFFTDKLLGLPNNISIKLNNKSTLKSVSLRDIEQLSYPPLLRYEDRNSMAFSIEARVPFMDYRLVEFLYSMPPEYLIRKGFTKAILRDSLKDILPQEIKKRKSKLGFETPESKWLQGPLKKYFKDYFFNMQNPYLNNIRIYEEFLCFPNSKLFSTDFTRFYIFDRWYQLNFNNSK